MSRPAAWPDRPAVIPLSCASDFGGALCVGRLEPSPTTPLVAVRKFTYLPLTVALLRIICFLHPTLSRALLALRFAAMLTARAALAVARAGQGQGSAHARCGCGRGAGTCGAEAVVKGCGNVLLARRIR